MSVQPDTIPTHPAAAIFPTMSDSAFEALRADISAHGQREPIALYAGQVVDGRRRLRACVDLGVEPVTETLPDDTDVMAYVISKNLHRRHLTVKQRAAIAAEMVTAERGGDRRSEEFKAPNGALKHLTQDEAAAAMQVGARSVDRARKTMREDPEQHEKDKAGEKPSTPRKGGAHKKPQAERLAEISALAAEGYRADQIAKQIGVSPNRVRLLAKKGGVDLPDKALGGTHKARPGRVIEETVHTLAGAALGLSTIDDQPLDITVEDAKAWSDTLAPALRRLQKLHRQLKEISHGQD